VLLKSFYVHTLTGDTSPNTSKLSQSIAKRRQMSPSAQLPRLHFADIFTTRKRPENKFTQGVKLYR
jgi:hypothetical protein